jgi:hypothetical protein
MRPLVQPTVRCTPQCDTQQRMTRCTPTGAQPNDATRILKATDCATAHAMKCANRSAECAAASDESAEQNWHWPVRSAHSTSAALSWHGTGPHWARDWAAQLCMLAADSTQGAVSDECSSDSRAAARSLRRSRRDALRRRGSCPPAAARTSAAQRRANPPGGSGGAKLLCIAHAQP